MVRVNSEQSKAQLSLDIALAPPQQGGVDPTLIGVFDETLRRAREPQFDRTADTAASSQRAERSDDRRTPHTTSKRESREVESRSTEETDTTRGSREQTKPTDEVTADRTDEDSAVSSEETTEAKEPESEAADSEESSDEAETEEAVVIASVVDEVVMQAAEESIGAEGEVEGDSAGTAATSAAATEVPNTQTPEASALQATAELETEQAAVQAVEPTVEVLEETTGEDPQDETEPKTGDTEARKPAEQVEGVDTDTADVSGSTETASETAEGPEPVSEEEESRKRAERRTGTDRRERSQQPEAPIQGLQQTAAEVSQAAPSNPGVTAAEVQEGVTAVDASLTTPEAAAADPGAANTASQTANLGGDGITAVEGKPAVNQGQAAAGQGSAKGTAEGVDAAKFVQRVASAFAALGQRTGPVRLKLYPPELGSLRMEITVKNGTMSARVEAETAAAKSVLMDNLPILRERLAEQGIKVDRFDVSLSDHSQGGPSERPDDNRSFRQSDGNNHPQTDTDTSESNRGDSLVDRTLSTDGRLDVFI